jgi:5-methyltetrahydrofolate--homocysteine methyltransferase
MTRTERRKKLEARAKTRVLVTDGAMGTAIQALGLGDKMFHGDRFATWPVPLRGDNDLLNLTLPDAIRTIHDDYLAAGADLIETNTFNATSISQADYGLQDIAAEIAREGAKLARAAADAAEDAEPERPRAVMGAIGPLSKTLSLSPKVEDPGYREVDFDQVYAAYVEQAEAMADFVDFFAIETVFDTLNAKAAIAACIDCNAKRNDPVPLMVSGTITDNSGRTLTGQTTEAFWNSIAHAKPWAAGLNCALGASELRPFVADMARAADCRIIAYPNAGLPNAFGEYDETPDTTSGHLGEWAKDGLVNIVGGCCGTTPAHIRAIVSAVENVAPRTVTSRPVALRLSGLEPFELIA